MRFAQLDSLVVNFSPMHDPTKPIAPGKFLPGESPQPSRPRTVDEQLALIEALNREIGGENLIPQQIKDVEVRKDG